eukprot:86634-Prorocentrum_minimum.AAC.2
MSALAQVITRQRVEDYELVKKEEAWRREDAERAVKQSAEAERRQRAAALNEELWARQASSLWKIATNSHRVSLAELTTWGSRICKALVRMTLAEVLSAGNLEPHVVSLANDALRHQTFIKGLTPGDVKPLISRFPPENPAAPLTVRSASPASTRSSGPARRTPAHPVRARRRH